MDASYSVSIAFIVLDCLDLYRYALMGSCRQLAVGPEALFAVLLGSILEKFDPVSVLYHVSLWKTYLMW